MFVRFALLCTLVLLVGCSPDPSQRRPRAEDIKGPQPLWAVSYVRGVRELDELENEQRAVMTWLDMIDTGRWMLTTDLDRLEKQVTSCPGPQQALEPSSTAHARDGIRARPINEIAGYQVVDANGNRGGPAGPLAQAERVKGDEALLNAAFHVSRADWYVRRAAASQVASHCESARADLQEAHTAITQLDGFATEALRIAEAYKP